MEDSGNKMKIDFAKKNEKIEHCGCASRLKIAIFVGSFQFSSRFISIDPWKFTNFITGKDQFIFFNDPNAAHCAMLKNFRRSFCLLLADLVVLFKKSAAICYFFTMHTLELVHTFWIFEFDTIICSHSYVSVVCGISDSFVGT